MDPWFAVLTAVLTATLSGGVALLLQFLVLPRLEREKTLQQELWKAKRDAFLEAAQLVDQYLACMPWEGAPADFEPSVDSIPDMSEVNRILHLLLLVSNDMRIPELFEHMFVGVISGQDRSEFLSRLRNELFASRENIRRVPFFLPRSKEVMRAILEQKSDIDQILSKVVDQLGCRVESIEFHKPQLGDVTVHIRCPSTQSIAKCQDILRTAAQPGRIWCRFDDEDTPKRLMASDT